MSAHVIPDAWEFAILALGAYRLTRLVGWDDFPPIAALRAWLLGEGDFLGEPTYRRPLLAHLVHCPFCVGWWISLGTYLAWVALGRWALAALLPFAISGVVGLIAKNLDG